MSGTIYLISGFLIGIGLVLVFSRKARDVLRPARDKLGGICAAVLGQSAKKQDNKEKIIAMLREKGELSNSDIREALGVSPRTVVSYMDELEREGKVGQTDKTGKYSRYRIKPF